MKPIRVLLAAALWVGSLVGCADVEQRPQVDKSPATTPWTKHTMPGGVHISCPSDWELGTPGFRESIWVALPPFAAEGNVVLRAIPTPTWFPELFTEATKGPFRDGLVAGNDLYADMVIGEFDNRVHVSGRAANYLTYTATTIADTLVDGVMLVTWHDGILYTFQAEYQSLTRDEVALLKRVAMTLTLD